MKLPIILFLMICSISLLGQDNIKPCEFEKGPLYEDIVKDVLSGLEDDVNLGLTSIPVALTFLMRTDSSSAYYEGLENEIMDSIQSHFIPAGIHFYLAEEPIFIYEDLVYDLQVGNNDEILNFAFQHNRIDIMIANSILYQGSQVCGVAKTLPSTIFSRYSCIPSNTISHEIGHELGLIHTHDTANGVEFVNGDNCETAGDLICDTPADPNRSDLISADCEWEGTYEDTGGYEIDLVDPNGDIYETDVSNLMSYYGVYGCRNDFSFMQSVLMNNKINQWIFNFGYETALIDFEVYDRVNMCDNGYSVSVRVVDPDLTVEYEWDFDSDGVIDATGADASHQYLDYGQYTIMLIKTYPDGRQFYRSKRCIVNYSNELITAPFLDDFNEFKERPYVELIEQSVYKWTLATGHYAASDQIHINENSIMIYRIDLSELNEAVLEFDYKCNANSTIGGDSLLIELLTCDKEPVKLFEKWGQDLGTNGAYENVIIPLGVQDDMISLKFTSKGDHQDFHDIQIDNLEIYENPLTATKETSNDETIVFPNLTSSSVHINANFAIDKIELLDAYGRTISTTYDKTEIDLSDLTPALYFLKIYNGDTWTLRRIVKLD